MATLSQNFELPVALPDDQRVCDVGDRALLSLLQALDRRGYQFVTPTPATHARVVARPSRGIARSLTDVFGWSLPFTGELLDDELSSSLRAAGGIELLPDRRMRSRFRISSLHGRLYLHSAFPTDSEDAVFLGPDSYRFADLIESELARDPPAAGARLVDIGAGAGVGAIVAAGLHPDIDVTMTDINDQALRLARINAQAAGIDADVSLGAALDKVEGRFDIILINPPFIIDPHERDYRNGGGMHGGALALELARAALQRLRLAGRLIFYTGSAIIDGDDALRIALASLAAHAGFTIRYREVDPDIFGEELDAPAYAEVDRIAAVAAIVTRGG